MLVLSRKQNQKIRIGNDVVITIVNISESSVKIGIEAPTSVKILRDELYESVKQQVSEAQKSTASIDMETIKQIKHKFKKE